MEEYLRRSSVLVNFRLLTSNFTKKWNPSQVVFKDLLTFETNTLKEYLRVVASGVFTVILIQSSCCKRCLTALLISIFYLYIFLIPYKTQQRQPFWMTHTCKSLKIVCVKFFDNVGCTMVADFAFVILHHLKSICRTLDYNITDSCGKEIRQNTLWKISLELVTKQSHILNILKPNSYFQKYK